MAKYELAQMNVSRLRAPLDSPQLADFVGALDRINAIAESSPGFVWRLQDDAGNVGVMRRRREWFEKMDFCLVLWWIPRGHRSTAEEGIEHLNLLRSRGASADAFSFGKLFPAPDSLETVGGSLDTPCPTT